MDGTEQYIAWCHLIPGYKCMSKNQRKNAKAKYKLANSAPCAINNKEKAMDTTTIYDVQDDQRMYLRGRAQEIRDKVESHLMEKFHMNDDPSPTTPAEVVKRIKDGMVEYPSDEEWKRLIISNCWVAPYPWHNFRWRNPATPPDKEGFKAAWNEFFDSTIPVEDAIAIQDPKDALAMLQKFEKEVS